jgi:DNA-binding transcriptional LysR family regulator
MSRADLEIAGGQALPQFPLSRAIQQLEGELGGPLFRRERHLAHVTELGERTLPS